MNPMQAAQSAMLKCLRKSWAYPHIPSRKQKRLCLRTKKRYSSGGSLPTGYRDSRMLKRWNLLCACAVGMNPANEKYREILKESNPTDIPIFYLRGKLDMSKLKWLQRKLLETIRTDLEKQNKPGTEEMVTILKDGCDFVSEDMLKEVLAYIMMKQ